MHVTQIKRYKAGASLPSLEAINKIAQVLRVTTDFLIFEESELVPDANLALQFQAIASMPEPQQAVIRQLLEDDHQVRGWALVSSDQVAFLRLAKLAALHPVLQTGPTFLDPYKIKPLGAV